MFFASLVASLALAIGLAIYDLTLRELDLASVTSQSQVAIYAADTGAECALYWDSKYNCSVSGGSTICNSAFATSSASITPTTIQCATQDLTIGPIASTCPSMGTNGCADASNATTTFTATLPAQVFNLGSVTPCVYVEVGKAVDVSGTVHTTVVSHGHNTCSGGTQVERALQLTY